MRLLKLIFSAFLFFNLLSAFAQTDSLSIDSIQSDLPADVFSMSMEDLMNVKVTTASKSSEKIQQAPAIITVMSSREIEGFGSLSLADLLDRLSSTYMISTSFAPSGMLAIRGKQTEHYNTNVLILIDGRPLRESFHGGYNGLIYSMFPVNSLERIEMIRGPGSVLYGSNAYVGVINLITKKGSDNKIQGTIRYGTFNTVQALVSANKSYKDLQIAFAVSALQTDGWDFTARGESDVIRNKKNTADSLFKDPKTIKRDNKGVGATLKLQYKGLTLNVFSAANEWSTMGRITDWPNPISYKIVNNRLFADLGYESEFNKYWYIAINGTYNHFDFKSFSPGQNDVLTKRESDDVLFEITNYIKPTEKINIVLGGLSNMQSGKGIQPDLTSNGKTFKIADNANPDTWVTVSQYDIIWNSAYLQADYTPIKLLKIIAGGQANKITGFKTDFVPRLGLIISPAESFGLKLLYGQAFRAASAFERSSLSPPSVYGNILLTPEKITTYEAQVFYTKHWLDISATYFYNFDNNKITRENVRDTILFGGTKVPFSQKYVNSGSIVTQGIELETKLKLASTFQIFGSATYQESIDNLERANYDGMPNLIVKLGALYNFKDKINTGIFGNYFGTTGDITRYNNNGQALTKMANPSSQPYVDLSLNISANIKNILSSKSFPNLLVHCYITNILDEKIYYPEVVRRNINTLPGRPGRAINVGATIKF